MSADSDDDFATLSRRWLAASVRRRYSYGFTWLGRPVIQYPQDLLALQELLFRIRPRLVIETGIAHGGSLIFHASLLELLGDDGRVLGIDIDIRAHNRSALDAHPLRPRIDLLEGSSIDAGIAEQVHARAAGRSPVLVVLDSMHTEAHVLAELRLYSPLVAVGSYVVVLDTIIEDLPDDLYPDRPWSRGNNPKTAVHAFLGENKRFEIDHEIEARLGITTAPDGFLRCVRA